MPRIFAKDASGNGPSAQALTTDTNRAVLIYNSASGETGGTFYARDFRRASIFVIDVDVGAGDTVVLEVRSDDSQAWGIEQTITVDGGYAFTPTEQFRIRRTVAAATTKAWLTTRIAA
jgi:hypothetical protein